MTEFNISHYNHSNETIDNKVLRTAIHETVFLNLISYNTFVSMNNESAYSLATLVRVIFIIQLNKVL